MKIRLLTIVAPLLAALVCGFGFTSGVAQAQGVNPLPKATGDAIIQLRTLDAALKSALKDRETQQERLAYAEKNLSILKDEQKRRVADQDNLGVSLNSFSEVLKNLQAQRVNLTIELAGLAARYDLLMDQKVKLQKPAAQETKALEELKKAIEIQKEKLKAVKAAGVNPDQINTLEMQLLDSQIGLAALTKRSTDSRLISIQNQLFQVSLDRTQNKAKLQQVEKMLKKYVAAREDLDTMDTLLIRITDQKKTTGQIKNDLSAIEMKAVDLRKAINKLKSQFDFDN